MNSKNFNLRTVKVFFDFGVPLLFTFFFQYLIFSDNGKISHEPGKNFKGSLFNDVLITEITSPSDNSSFNAGSDITIQASASGGTGPILKVEFFEDTIKLGEDETSPYSFMWNNVSAGNYTLTVKATDSINNIAVSEIIHVIVSEILSTEITSPSNNSSFNAGSDITIQASASGGSGPILKIEFFNDTVKLGEDESAPYSFIWNNVSAGNYSLTAKATDSLNSAVSPKVNITVNPLAIDSYLISANSIWKYLDDGTSPDSTWKNISFIDSAWKTGNAELGYGDGGESTIISYGPSSANKYISTYFRKKFNVPDISNISNLELGIIRDDGAVVYLNGEEVYRTNMAAGTILSTSLASTAINGAAESNYLISSLNSSGLLQGENVLGVEIHQQNGGSSDISFNLKLKPIPPDTTRLVYTPNIFAVIGDFGLSGPGEAAVATMVKSWQPEFIITVGDNNYPDGEYSTIDNNIGQYYHDYIHPYRGSYGKGADSLRFFPTLGNHDWTTSNADPYLQYFTLPGNERYYDFIKGDIHFFVINSDIREPDGSSGSSIQALWLKEKLAASSSKWKIVYLHHSPFASDNSGSQLWIQWPFKIWGADIVLSGHSHVYERLKIDNFPYIIDGTGGGNLTPFKSTSVSGSLVRYNTNFGALKVKVMPDTLWFKFYNINNELIDNYPLVKNPVLPQTAITSPPDNSLFNTGSTITIQATASGGTGAIQKVEFFSDSTKLGEAKTSPYSFTWNNVPDSSYALTVQATDSLNKTAVSEIIHITVAFTEICNDSGAITREVWNNISGTSVSAIPLSSMPDSSGILSVFESPQIVGDNYGQRIRGYVCPPITGNYTFWIASDDYSELWLSPNEKSIDKNKIASVSGYTLPSQWTKYASQQSVPVSLIAGQKYYIEALHKEGVRGDNLAVGWQLPFGIMERPIPGLRLSPGLNIPLSQTPELISANSLWKYLDNGSNEGNTWNDYSFNDSSWKAGNAELGYGDGNEQTIVSYGPSDTNKYTTTYFRQEFTVPEISDISGLELSFIRDDGIVVYLNGAEVYRNNMPSSKIYYNTFASSFVDGINESTWVKADISHANLVKGNNVLAVEIHQNSLSSSDISFNLILEALFSDSTLDPKPLYANIISPSNYNYFNIGSAINIQAAASGGTGSLQKVEFFSDATRLGEDTASPYTHSWNDAGAGTYELTARVTDSINNTAVSEIIYVNVTNSISAAIISPANNSLFIAGSNITIQAIATGGLGTIQKVEFFDDTIKLDEDSTSPYFFTWENVIAGTYLLIAKATDSINNTSASDSVTINVMNPLIANITFPANKSFFYRDSTITIQAIATGGLGTIQKVEFFSGTFKLGEDSTSPYSFEWDKVSPDEYALTVKATDSINNTSVSEIITVIVTDPLNAVIVSPADNSAYNSGSDIFIQANATGGMGTLKKVEFFAGALKLGEDVTNPYSITWNNVSAGTFALTAKASDSLNNTAVSEIINVSVNDTIALTITSPANSSFFYRGSNITIQATAKGGIGTIQKVEFFSDTFKLGEDSTSPYSFTWDNVSLGNYTLTTRASDSINNSAVSEIINVIVVDPLTAVITSPADNSSYNSGSDISIQASATGGMGTLKKVEFFAGTFKLGEDVTNPYSITWNNVSAGTFALTAKASDSLNNTAVSEIIKIYVNDTIAVTITSPSNNSSFIEGSNITIQASAKGGIGTIQKVEFFADTSRLGEDATSPYSLIRKNDSVGNYALSARATDSMNNSAVSEIINIKVTQIDPCNATGTITREVWNNISGKAISAIPINSEPGLTEQLSIFETPKNSADNYGQRISGYVCPLVTGNYLFWISSDDNSELWLSTTGKPEDKIKIAFVSGYTSSRQWLKYPSQQSVPVPLIAGRQYFIEALHKEGARGDNLAVGWQLPNGTLERPIPGLRLSPGKYIPPPPTQEIISANSSWKYLDNGSNQGTSWRAPGFNDSLWKTGNAELGYGDGGESTVVSFGSSSGNKYITTYFRKKFFLSDISVLSGLELNFIRDDGIVIYLNGGEVYRNNMPASTIYYNTLAPSYIDGLKESTWVESIISSDNIISGNNVIAVEIHQNSLTSSDISFNLKLKGLSSSSNKFYSAPASHPFTNDHDSIYYSRGDFIVYPNPFNGLFTLEYCLDSIKEKEILVEIYNPIGQILFEKNLPVVNECVREVIELDKNILPGMYIMNVIADGNRESKRIILSK